VREAKDSTAQTMDAATQDQAAEQKPMVGEDGDEPPKDDEQMDVVEEGRNFNSCLKYLLPGGLLRYFFNVQLCFYYFFLSPLCF
jgi:hypothetical protein